MGSSGDRFDAPPLFRRFVEGQGGVLTFHPRPRARPDIRNAKEWIS
jgi:hypothetical protein